MSDKESLLIASRLRDYDKEDLTEQRKRLVEAWRKHYPEAAKETSNWLKPLVRMEEYEKRSPDEPDEQWYNDIYFVTLRRHKKDPVFGTWDGMIQLGIASLDGTARHDWRDFQAIKNQLAGPECEAFELYPAESRLLDPSNYYTLWCFPGVKRLKIGLDERRAFDADIALAPQRAVATGNYQEAMNAVYAAQNALRSYQYGNSAPDLAAEVADALDGLVERLRSGNACSRGKDERVIG